jgi:hypothetical protein
MSRTPQEESIYTLQRRIGTQRQRLDAQPAPTNAKGGAPEGSKLPQRGRFTLGALFSLRIRAA